MSLLSLQVSLYNGFTSFSPIPFTTLYGITIDENFAGDFFRKLSQRLKEVIVQSMQLFTSKF